jgi:hypothetical protein
MADVTGGFICFCFFSTMVSVWMGSYFCVWNRIGLLAFHLALVNNPQEASVIWAFASTLYHGNQEKGVKFAKEHAQMHVNFVPEISGSSDFKSDEEIAEGVTLLASLVQDSIAALTNRDSLFESMCRYPTSPCSGFVSTYIP